MSEVTLLRLYVLRATYLLIAVGLGVMIWPSLIDPVSAPEHMRGVVRALLGAMGLLALLGIRYPLQMLPLLMFELVWKLIWIVAIGIPLRSAGALDEATRATWFDCVFGIIVCLIAIPWGYVIRSYVRRPADPWTHRDAPPPIVAPAAH